MKLYRRGTKMEPLIMIILGFLLLALCIKVGIDNSKLSRNHNQTLKTLEDIKELLYEIKNNRNNNKYE
jgi:hypothetical protein